MQFLGIHISAIGVDIMVINIFMQSSCVRVRELLCCYHHVSNMSGRAAYTNDFL